MEQRSKASELAHKIREVAEALSVAELREKDIAEADRLAATLQDLVTGPRRRRWYDAGADPQAPREARRAYLDQSPIRGRLNPVAPPLELETMTRADGTQAVQGSVRMGMRYEGPPHGVHGGWVAALFDEVCGAVQGLAGTRGVTGVLKVRYRQITPLEETLRFEGWVADQRGRRLVAKATCHAGDTLTAQAQALFVDVDFRDVQQGMLDRRRRSRDGP